jgi:uncharacterized protein (DUF427 family)
MVDLKALRAQWHWRGQSRPAFAPAPGPDQESVWDYPRPPRIEFEKREIVVRWETLEIARTQRALRILETAHPPSYYLPWDDVAREYFKPAPGSSLCEWKGAARYWSLEDGRRRLANVAWSYPQPFKAAECLADCVALYPTALECRVGGALVMPQPGGFYGGWVTPELVGPFKGDPGSSHW